MRHNSCKLTSFHWMKNCVKLFRFKTIVARFFASGGVYLQSFHCRLLKISVCSAFCCHYKMFVPCNIFPSLFLLNNCCLNLHKTRNAHYVSLWILSIFRIFHENCFAFTMLLWQKIKIILKKKKYSKQKKKKKKKKKKPPYLFQYKLSYRNETGSNHHGKLSTSVWFFKIFLRGASTWGVSTYL